MLSLKSNLNIHFWLIWPKSLTQWYYREIPHVHPGSVQQRTSHRNKLDCWGETSYWSYGNWSHQSASKLHHVLLCSQSRLKHRKAKQTNIIRAFNMFCTALSPQLESLQFCDVGQMIRNHVIGIAALILSVCNIWDNQGSRLDKPESFHTNKLLNKRKKENCGNNMIKFQSAETAVQL